VVPSTKPAEPGSLPTGTVTFLFTDIEGSTKLLDRLRADYAALLAEQRDILRASIAEWNGVEVDTQGDSFFVAFSRAADALACAADTQRQLSTHRWPQDVVVRVRMGLHTGEPVVMRTGYVGMDVHRAARIGAAGHGGQILLSAVTRQLAGDELPPESELVDLGEHRLKDVRGATRIYQLTVAGLPDTFPPLRTLATGDEPPAPGEPPFMGLQHYDESNANLFFGREAITARLVDRIRVEPFLAIVGASGSGKSSIARAGVAPQIRGSSGEWLTRVLTPGERPLETLAMALNSDAGSLADTASLMDDLRTEPRSLHLAAVRLLSGGRHQPTSRLLLIVDQFEELFTLSREVPDRDAFIATLMAAVGTAGGPVHVVITLRADFYGHLAGYRELRDAVAAHQEYVGPMSADELRRAIELPAAGGGWEFVPGLVDLILRDVGSEPGALPLLSHALLETWRRRRGTSLTLKGYSESGGVQRAIARTADRVFDTELDTEQREMARNIFLRLTELGEGTQDMRRRVSLREIVPEDSERSIAVRAVLQRLADRRLVTVAESTVEVAHEALIREWPRLREWLDEDRAGLRVHRRLTEAAHEWERLGRDDGALLRGVRLAEAVEWRQHNEASLNPLEGEFLTASQALAIAERVSRERSRRRLSVAAVGLSIVFLAVAAAAGLQWMRAEEQRNIAEGERGVALARQLAAQAEANEGQDDLALLLAVEGYRDADVPETRSSLLGRLVSNPALSGFLPGHSAEVTAIAFAPDNQTLVSSGKGEDGVADVRLWDLTAGRQLGDAIRSGGAGVGVTLDPAGNWVAWAAPEGIRVRDRVAGTTRSGPRPRRPFDGLVYRGDTNSFLTAGQGGGVKEWDFETLALRRTLIDDPDPSSGDTTALSRDGHWYLVGGEDGAISAWDLSEPQPHKELLRDGDEGLVSRPPTLAVSRNGTSLAALDRGVLTLWDVPGRKLRARIVLEQGSDIITMAMSPAGDLLAIGRLDGTIEFVDMLTANPRGALAGYEVAVTALVFDDTGSYLASGYDDGRLALWRPAADTRLDASIALPAEINIPKPQRVAISPDAGRLAVIESNESVAVWNLITGALVNRIRVPHAMAMQFGTPVVGIPVAIPVAISGNIMVVLDSTRITASVWDVAQGSLVGELAPPGLVQPISAVAIDPGGRTVALGAGADIFVMIVGQEEPMLQISVDRRGVSSLFVSSLAFSADGSVLAIGTDAPRGNARINTFDTLSGAPVGKTVLLNADAASALAFTSDERNVAVVTRRGEAPAVTSEVLLVDTERGLPIGPIGRLAVERFAQSLAYDRRTGAIISSRLADGEMAGWTVEPDAWARLACRIANRNLATEEWGRFVGLGPYEATCPDVADASR
jgi:class 3 adenylate cyclase/WD40 repeat protein